MWSSLRTGLAEIESGELRFCPARSIGPCRAHQNIIEMGAILLPTKAFARLRSALARSARSARGTGSKIATAGMLGVVLIWDPFITHGGHLIVR